MCQGINRRQFQSWICPGSNHSRPTTYYLIGLELTRESIGISSVSHFGNFRLTCLHNFLCSGWNNTHHSYNSLSAKSPERTKLHRPGRTGLLARTFQATQAREGNKLSVAINLIIFLIRRIQLASLSETARREGIYPSRVSYCVITTHILPLKYHLLD